VDELAKSDIGVVIIGRNEGQRLVECLNSVSEQADKVVYVDSGSSDDSVSIAEQKGVLVVKLDSAQPYTAARARNEGFAALMEIRPRLRFVQFIDGDCELVGGWLDSAHAFIAHRNDVAIVCGRRRECYPRSSVYNRLCDIEWATAIGQAMACGGDSMMRVEAFDTVGGFRAGLIAGEEPELCIRLRKKGWKIWRLDADMTRHDANIMRLSQWWVRFIRSGHAYAEVFWLHKQSKFGIYRKETARAVFWGGFAPLLIAMSAFFDASLLWGILVYPLEICWIALRRGIADRDSWIYALFMTVAKFAEFQGILKFAWRHWRIEDFKIIEYKKSA
jgi:glycosyltransferase involved in cell wall biosynthesis